MKKIVAVVVLIPFFIIQMVGCSQKQLDITYKTEGRDLARNNLCQSKFGVFLFDDIRQNNSSDKMFRLSPQIMVQNLILDKFNAHCGGNTIPIDFESKNVALLRTGSESSIDFAIVGKIDEFSIDYEDPNSGIRGVGSFLTAITFPIGLVFAPFLFMGKQFENKKIRLKDIYIIDVNNNVVVWKGDLNVHTTNTVPYASVTKSYIQSSFTSSNNRIMDDFYKNIAMSYDMQFPTRLSKSESKILMDYMGGFQSTMLDMK